MTGGECGNNPRLDGAPGEPEPRGIRCPKCGCGHFEVVYTRKMPSGEIRRRRECRYCGRRVTTTERMGA